MQKFRIVPVCLVLTCLVLAFLAVCDRIDDLEAENSAPEILLFSREPGHYDWGETVTMFVVAIDADNDSLLFRWDIAGGSPTSSRNDTILWTAPDQDGDIIAMVWVSDRIDSVFSADTLSVYANPQLTVTPDLLDFGSSTDTLMLRLGNSGTGRLSFTLEKNADWLELSLSEGVLRGQADADQSGGTEATQEDITAVAKRSGLAPGTYEDDIRIRTDTDSITMVHIQMAVSDDALKVSTFTLDFGRETSELTFTMTNDGTQPVLWEAAGSGNWITVVPDTGTITDTQDISVRVTRDSSLFADLYTGSVDITSTGGDASVEVRMEVPESVTARKFRDDFSGDLSGWSAGEYGDAWIDNDVLHLTCSNSGYYGSLYHEFESTVQATYVIECAAAMPETVPDEAQFTIILITDDTGMPAIPYLRFVVSPGQTENWSLQAFLVTDVSAGWYYLSDLSHGYSEWLDDAFGSWQDISWEIDDQSDIHIDFGNENGEFFTSSELTDLENLFQQEISTGLVRFGFQATYDLDMMFDNVTVVAGTAGGGGRNAKPVFLRSRKGYPGRVAESSPEEKMTQIQTIREALGSIRK